MAYERSGAMLGVAAVRMSLGDACADVEEWADAVKVIFVLRFFVCVSVCSLLFAWFWLSPLIVSVLCCWFGGWISLFCFWLLLFTPLTNSKGVWRGSKDLHIFGPRQVCVGFRCFGD